MGTELNGQTEENQKKNYEAKLHIQDLYERLQRDGAGRDQAWLQLLEAMKNYAAPAVWEILNKGPFRTKTHFEDIVSAAAEVLYRGKAFTGYQKRLEIDPQCMFSDYCRGIYKHKALDYVNALISRQEVNIEDYPHIQESAAFPEMEEDALERLVKYYVDAVMQSGEDPFRIMFLCYSKILPVILDETRCTSADTWAWKHMQGKTLAELSDTFVKVFNSTMNRVRIELSPEYLAELAKPYRNREGVHITMAEAVLTDEFTKSYTKNWVVRMNARVIKAAVKNIIHSGDEEVMELTMQYTRGKYGMQSV